MNTILLHFQCSLQWYQMPSGLTCQMTFYRKHLIFSQKHSGHFHSGIHSGLFQRNQNFLHHRCALVGQVSERAFPPRLLLCTSLITFSDMWTEVVLLEWYSRRHLIQWMSVWLINSRYGVHYMPLLQFTLFQTETRENHAPGLRVLETSSSM